MYLWQLGNRERQKAYLFPLAGVSVSFSFLATVVTIAIRACGQLSPLWRTLTILKSTRNFRRTLEQKILKFEQNLYYVDPVTLLQAWIFNPYSGNSSNSWEFGLTKRLGWWRNVLVISYHAILMLLWLHSISNYWSVLGHKCQGLFSSAKYKTCDIARVCSCSKDKNIFSGDHL